jgi:hypothetical protein
MAAPWCSIAASYTLAEAAAARGKRCCSPWGHKGRIRDVAHWNFRVIRSQDALGVCYAMHDCYYDHEGDALPTSWAPEQSPVRAGSRDDLFWALAAMTEAISKPVLEVRAGELVEAEPALELTEELKAAIKKTGPGTQRSDSVLDDVAL